MIRNEKQARETKHRVLEAACQVFAEVGYREGTVAKICERAGANRAAVNYHYGDKENLYRSVWRYTYSLASKAHPIEPTEAGLPAERRLHAFMRSLVLRMFDEGPGGLFARIVAKEFPEPQEFMVEEFRRVHADHALIFDAVVREMLGNDAGQDDLRVCRLMILMPSLGLGMRRLSRHSRFRPP
ncbi:TetR/AcrR family transcriptional regulator, partial [bacterium]|nr:TetR/AcrR family transcriptional regulator [bacterium]